MLPGIEEAPIDDLASRHVGALLARTGTRDVVDAHVALLTGDADMLWTSDVGDLRRLLSANGCTAEVIAVS